MFGVYFRIIAIMRKYRNDNEMLFYIQTVSRNVNGRVICGGMVGDKTCVLDVVWYRDIALRMKKLEKILKYLLTRCDKRDKI